MNLNRLAFLAAAALMGITATNIGHAQDAAARNLILRSGNTTAANVGTLGVTTLTAPRSYTFPDKDGTILVTPAAMNPLSVLRTDAVGNIETVALTDGQLLIGATGGLPTAATLTGTTNQVSVTNGANSITLSLPQNIHTGASPTFLGLTITDGPIALTTTGANDITVTVGGDLKLVGIDALAPITDLLWIDGSNNVRRAPFTGTAAEGVEFQSSAYRLGGQTNATNPLTSNRFVNVDDRDLAFTGAGGAQTILLIDGDAANGQFRLNSFGLGEGVISSARKTKFISSSATQPIASFENSTGTAVSFLEIADHTSSGHLVIAVQNAGGANYINNNTGRNLELQISGTTEATISSTGVTVADDLTVGGITSLNGAVNAGNGDDNVNINAGTGTFQLITGTGLNVGTTGDLSSAAGAVIVNDAQGLNVQLGGVDIDADGLNVDAGGATITGATTLTTGANELTITGLAADNTLTSMLTLNGSNQVRTTALNSVAWLVGGNTFTGGSTYTIGTNSADNLAFETGGTNQMILETDGDLGIGTATAAAPLHVARSAAGGAMDVLFMNSAPVGTINSAVQISFANDNGASTTVPNAFIRSENTGGLSNAATLYFGTWDGAATGWRMSIAPGGAVTINSGGANDLTISETTISRTGNIDVNPGAGNDITTDGGITSAENVTITSGGLTVTAGGANITGATTLATGASELTITGLAADNTLTSMLTLNGSNQVRTTALNDVAWLLGGNTLTAAATIGSNSAHNVEIEANGTTRLTIESGSATVTAAADIVPSAHSTYDLGTDAVRWEDVYLDGSSLHIGPTGGQAANTELAVGYNGSAGTFNANSGTAELTLGTDAVTAVGATSINANAAFNTNINTGTSTGAVTIGGGAGTVAIASTGLNVSPAGVISDAGGDVEVNDNLNVAGTVTINSGVANDLTISETTISRTGNIAINPGALNTVTTNGSLNVGATLDVTDGTMLNGAVTAGNGNDNVSINAGTGTFQLNSSGLNVNTSGELSNTAGAVIVDDAQGLNVQQGGVDIDAGGLNVDADGATIEGTTSINTTAAANTTTIGNNTVGNSLAINAPVVTMTNLPAAAATANVFIVEEAGEIRKRTITGSVLSGTGTNGRMTRWGAGNTLQDASLNDDGAGTLSRTGSIAINPGAGNDITTDGGITSAENVTITSGGLTVTAGGANITGATTLTTGASELTITGLAADNTLTSMLTLNGSNQVRTTALNDVAWLLGGNTLTAAAAIGSNSAHNVEIEANGTTRLTIQSATATVTAAADIVPSAHSTYDLGTDAVRWQDVYVDGTSLHIGPTGGQAGNTELAIGYAGSAATFNANAGVTTELTLGSDAVTVEGVTNINNDANFATNINTGTSTGAVTIGNSGSGGVVTITSSLNTDLDAAAQISLGGVDANAVTIGNASSTVGITGTTLTAAQSDDITLTRSAAGVTTKLLMDDAQAALTIGEGTNSGSAVVNIGRAILDGVDADGTFTADFLTGSISIDELDDASGEGASLEMTAGDVTITADATVSIQGGRVEKVEAVNAAHALLASDYIIIQTADADITLPTTPEDGRTYIIRNQSVGAIDVIPDAGEYINDLAAGVALNLAVNTFVKLVFLTDTWYTIGN